MIKTFLYNWPGFTDKAYGAFTPDANEALSASDLHVKSMKDAIDILRRDSRKWRDSYEWRGANWAFRLCVACKLKSVRFIRASHVWCERPTKPGLG